MSLELADDVTCRPAESWSLTVTGGTESVPVDASNLAWRAAAALVPPGASLPPVQVSIAKRIPVGAGLAGGSADAAAVLRLLGGERPDLAALGLALGADIPYCLDGRPAIVRGIGERITPFVPGLSLHLVVANPGFSVSTREIFQALNAAPLGLDSEPEPGESPGNTLSAVLGGARTVEDLRSAAVFMANDLQPVTTRLYPAVLDLIAQVEKTGAIKVQMSGSGPTVFGIYPDRASADTAARTLSSHVPFVRAVDVVPDPSIMAVAA